LNGWFIDPEAMHCRRASVTAANAYQRGSVVAPFPREEQRDHSVKAGCRPEKTTHHSTENAAVDEARRAG